MRKQKRECVNAVTTLSVCTERHSLFFLSLRSRLHPSAPFSSLCNSPSRERENTTRADTALMEYSRTEASRNRNKTLFFFKDDALLLCVFVLMLTSLNIFIFPPLDHSALARTATSLKRTHRKKSRKKTKKKPSTKGGIIIELKHEKKKRSGSDQRRQPSHQALPTSPRPPPPQQKKKEVRRKVGREEWPRCNGNSP